MRGGRANRQGMVGLGWAVGSEGRTLKSEAALLGQELTWRPAQIAGIKENLVRQVSHQASD